jgi:hypothetical protein
VISTDPARTGAADLDHFTLGPDEAVILRLAPSGDGG